MVPDHVEQFINAPLGRLGTIRTVGWSFEDRAVLVGDSAHGIVPFHGQGMNLALESAAALDRMLQAHPHDLAAAFEAFEADRGDDANAIADMALENYVEMRDKVNDPDYLLKRQLSLLLAERVPRALPAPLQHGHVLGHPVCRRVRSWRSAGGASRRTGSGLYHDRRSRHGSGRNRSSGPGFVAVWLDDWSAWATNSWLG